MSYFTQSRNAELSSIYYLDSNLSADWSGTTVVKTFTNAYAKDINVPIVCVRLSDTNSVRKEIGANTLEDRYLIIIDLFARSNSQRLDMAYYIKDKLKDGYTYYLHAHASGDSNTLTRVANGRCQVTDWISDSKIDLGDNGDTKDKFRHTISFRIRVASL